MLGPRAFSRHILKGKAKWDEDADEGASKPPNKRKNKRRRGGSLVANIDCTGGQKPTEGTSSHFKKLLTGPCPNHAFPVKHLYKDCIFLKRFLFGSSNKGEHRTELS